MDTWQNELILGISREMLSKPAEGVFGECCTKDTDGDMRRVTLTYAVFCVRTRALELQK